MTNKYMKKWSAPLINKKIKVKTTMKYHFTFIKMSIFIKTREKKCR